MKTGGSTNHVQYYNGFGGCCQGLFTKTSGKSARRGCAEAFPESRGRSPAEVFLHSCRADGGTVPVFLCKETAVVYPCGNLDRVSQFCYTSGREIPLPDVTRRPPGSERAAAARRTDCLTGTSAHRGTIALPRQVPTRPVSSGMFPRRQKPLRAKEIYAGMRGDRFV